MKDNIGLNPRQLKTIKNFVPFEIIEINRAKEKETSNYIRKAAVIYRNYNGELTRSYIGYRSRLVLINETNSNTI